ncbi:MAG: PASTA domain-containing protein [Clostridiales bacterium]|jgi:stage V sporulation protein D (sporulation-specific penicillin-binding protein)|nr:PASTA domain-containing protein [Clostridiales bacterium]
MDKPSIDIKKKIVFILVVLELAIAALVGRVFYIQAFMGDDLQKMAYEQQTRDRLITPERGEILDRNMVGLAVSETVASVSVIHSQIKDEEEVAKVLSERLQLDYNTVLQKVSKKVALERIKTKVKKEEADAIRALNLPGVVVDEDIKRVYPFSTLASQVLGFVGKDNQGIIGLEAKYEQYLKGSPGKILTETDVAGRELPQGRSYRQAPVQGYNLVTSLDVVLQEYAEQTIEKTIEIKNAKRGAIIIMNPQNGEILAMANKPDFDLNDPFTINDPELAAVWDTLSEKEKGDSLNQMWRNFSLNDTYEPGSTFKIVTSAAGLEENVVNVNSTFSCSGSVTVGGRQIKCWRYPRAHGGETFVEGVQNSCNPVFMEVASRLGADKFYDYLIKFGFNEKTGIDLPGEATGIMYKADKIGPVELATMSFGQSLAITPIQLLRAASATVNGGYLVTPHFGAQLIDDKGETVETFKYEQGRQVVSEETSETMKMILESVVFSGTGNKTYIAGYRVGGKTATSEKLPRRSGKYIASFLAFAPAENPQVMALVLIDEPQGSYYGGAVAGPVMKEVLENALPYLNVKPEYSQEESGLPEAARIEVPDVRGLTTQEAKKILTDAGLTVETAGEGDVVAEQFPLPGETLNLKAKVVIYLRKSDDMA